MTTVRGMSRGGMDRRSFVAAGIAAAVAGPRAVFAKGRSVGPVFLSEGRLRAVREKIRQGAPTQTAALAPLLASAEAALQMQPDVPETWYVPGFYKDAAAHRKAKGALEQQSNAAYALALAWQLTGRVQFANAAVRLVNAWATGLKHMRTEDDSTLSFSYHFPALLLAAGLLDMPMAGAPAAAAWTGDVRDRFAQFVREQALPMNTAARENNWGNWGLVLLLSSAAFLQDRALLLQGAERWKHFIDTQIADDGHLPAEVGRNNGVGEHGLWYSNFCLMPQTLAAEILRVNGTDLYAYRSPAGHTLRSAWERLVPWVAAPETFPYFKAESGQAVAQTDYISYWELLNTRWPNETAARLIRARRPMTAQHVAPFLSLTHGDLSPLL